MNLEQTGYSVATAKTGEEGLILFNNGDFDLVLADLQLPDMQGTEVMRRLKEKRPSIEVIIISRGRGFFFWSKRFSIWRVCCFCSRARSNASC